MTVDLTDFEDLVSCSEQSEETESAPVESKTKREEETKGKVELTDSRWETRLRVPPYKKRSPGAQVSFSLEQSLEKRGKLQDSPIVVSRQPRRSVQTLLKITLVGVRLEQLLPRLG